MTIAGYADRFKADLGIDISTSAVSRGLDLLGETRKKYTKQVQPLMDCTFQLTSVRLPELPCIEPRFFFSSSSRLSRS